MKTQKKLFEFKKNAIVELNDTKLEHVVGGTATVGECFLCIRTSNGPGGTVLEQLKQA